MQHQHPPPPRPALILTSLLLGLLSACSPPSATPTAHVPPATQPAPTEANPLLGTWEFRSGRYGDMADFTPANTNFLRWKLITPSHFIWAEFDRKTGDIQSTAGGRCVIDGTNYTETIDCIGPGMEGFQGATLRFTEELRGDLLYHRGALPDGTRIEEIWQRAHADRSP